MNSRQVLLCNSREMDTASELNAGQKMVNKAEETRELSRTLE